MTRTKASILLILITFILYFLVVSFGNISSATEKDKIVIALDPGHGGIQPGAVNGSLLEKNLTLKVANYIKEYLSEYDNVEVGLTHNGLPSNQELEIFDRGVYARNINADMLISLHFNSSDSSSPNGAEVYVTACKALPKYNENCTALANKILNNIAKLGIKNNGVKTRVITGDKTDIYYPGCPADWDGPIRYAMRGTMIDNGVTSVLKDGKKVKVSADTSADVKNGEGVPGILIEHCYIKSDAKYIDSEEDIKALAKADADGIIEHFGLTKEKEVTVQKDEEGKLVLTGPEVGKAELIKNISEATVTTQDGKAVEGDTLATGYKVKAGNKTYQVVKLGDINGDGKVTVNDSLRILRYCAKEVTLEGVFLRAVDANRDGKYTVNDSLRILNYKANISEIKL